MKSISDIDKNFKIETDIEREGIVFKNILNEPFSVHGLIRENDSWVRLPDMVAASVSPSVRLLSKKTAGGRVRFVTDSPYVAIKAIMSPIHAQNCSAHMAQTCRMGFDLYECSAKGEAYLKTFVPPVSIEENGYESCFDLPDAKKRIFTINFPLYHDVIDLYIGLKEGSLLEKAPDYSIKKPIVYYGSSVTQGGCASRPGNSYQAFLSRWFDADYINLGFSGNARGEAEIAEYIAGLDMSMFVYDYDYNSPSADEYRKTHESMFLRIREANPDLPIIMASRPRYFLNNGEKERLAIMTATYENAIKRGDKNVYMIPGNELMAHCKNDGTVDGTHPSDLGFYSMALRFAKEMEKVFPMRSNNT